MGKEMAEKLCIFCMHFYFYGGDRSYGEYTPATEGALTCEKGHYNHDEFFPSDIDLPMRLVLLPNDTDASAIIKKANDCEDYDLDIVLKSEIEAMGEE
jgi:hypothetical protein